jgi:hypothetical protein
VSPFQTCPRCGYTTDVTGAMREHYLRQMAGWDKCKPPAKPKADETPTGETK